MSDDTLRALRAQYSELERRLDAGLADAERAAVRAEIIALFRTAEQQATELAALKEDVKQLVDKWKAGEGAAKASMAPQFAGERPVVHADHLGASTFAEKGWSLLSLGDYDGAEAALLKALELSPGDVQSTALLGWAQMLNEKLDDAMMSFQVVLMKEPMNALARINVGFICFKKHIFGEAIEHLSKAIRLDNDKKATLYAHFYLGLVYLEREMYEDAENFFLKTLVLGPNLIEAYYELGRSYWFNGQQDDAKETWRKGHAANRFNPWGKRCEELLQAVEAGGAPTRP